MKSLNLFNGNPTSGKPPGNTKLVEYGIYQDNSQIHIHVAYGSQRVYIFETSEAAKLAASEKYKDKEAKVYTADIMTARGKTIPRSHIRTLKTVLIPLDIFRKFEAFISDTTSVKGARATQIAKEMIMRGMIPLPLLGSEISEKNLQISGHDITINGSLVIQVKCDWRAGQTGNIFIQTHEANPYKQI